MNSKTFMKKTARPEDIFLGRIFLGHQGPRRRDIRDPGPGMSRTRTLCKVLFSVVLDRKMAVMSRNLGRDVQGLGPAYLGSQKNFMQENTLDLFSFSKHIVTAKRCQEQLTGFFALTFVGETSHNILSRNAPGKVIHNVDTKICRKHP